MPADVQVADGHIQLDQSTLTGESLPVQAGSGRTAFAGSVVIHGEASGEVTATGARTYFGKTAELVRSATTVSHLQATIFTIVKYLVLLDCALVLILLLYSRFTRLPIVEMLPFALMLLVASVPVALPATFTLATALGSMELAGSGVLVTRLSAIEEAAAMEVLCSDKTGTITQNRLAVTDLQPHAPYGQDDLLRFAMLASDAASEDPIDLAILAAADNRVIDSAGWRRTELIPFEPATKLSEAIISDGAKRQRAIKGAPEAIARRVKPAPDFEKDVDRFAEQGYRVLGVAAGMDDDLRFVGLLALEDPPRSDSQTLIQNLHDLGVRVIMITGDGLATARAVATRVGIGGRAVEPKDLEKEAAAEVLQSDVFAGVYPEDKFHIVKALQRAGMVTGMTGDGVNDAPALKQAEVGIAVANATDVAKAAASLVLTNPGLVDILAAVKTSRRIYQRMLTYTLNKIIKTIEIALLLSVGVMLTRSFVITPLLIVLLLFTNDFVTMSIATDNVSYSPQPDRWHIRSLVLIALVLGSLILVFSFGIFLAGRYWLQLPLPQLQTLVFITLVFTGQGTVYLVRQRQNFWKSRPSKWLALSSAADVVVVSFLASRGILMEAIPPVVVFGVLIACGGYLVAVDFVKTDILKKLLQ